MEEYGKSIRLYWRFNRSQRAKGNLVISYLQIIRLDDDVPKVYTQAAWEDPSFFNIIGQLVCINGTTATSLLLDAPLNENYVPYSNISVHLTLHTDNSSGMVCYCII
jgi:hypothetical protein